MASVREIISRWRAYEGLKPLDEEFRQSITLHDISMLCFALVRAESIIQRLVWNEVDAKSWLKDFEG